jgi:ATP-dependent helicase/nuclease subunit A
VTRELPPPPDQAEREAIVRGRDRSMLVEASAGTGKTHILIEVLLYVALEAEPGLPLSQVAAVTFTEKAAGELKTRLRGKLLEAARRGDSERRRRARRALDDVERAEVSTIHAFCQALLKERPIDAGVDPGFTPIDAIASWAIAARVWHDWWRREVTASPNGPIAGALRRGASLGRPEDDERPSLSQLALALYRDRARLDGALPAEEAPRLLARQLGEWSSEIARAIAEAKIPKSQALDWLRELAAWLGDLARLAGKPKFTEVAARMPKGSFAQVKGLWPEARSAEIQELIRKRIQDLFDGKKLAEKAPHWALLAGILERLRDPRDGFFGAVAEEKRRRGVVDFDDLLLFARDLLRHSAPARAHFRRRFRLIALDEFQDTDLLQMEIVYRLTGADGGEADWRQIAPEPGRLLLVGDPKQSIYRFRRADVESYRVAREGLERRRLRANARSLPRLLEWIDAAFERFLIEDPERPWEIGYESFEPWRPGEAAGPRVVYLEPTEDFRGSGEKRDEEESAAVAAYVHELTAHGSFRAGQIGVLVRTNDRVADFQEALDRYEIPSVLEGGRDFFEREETAAVLAVLRAVDDPRDAVSVYAALKSAFFSFSDEDLFRARLAEAAFDFTRPGPVAGRLAEAFALLARLRRDRHARPAAETLADLYEVTGAIETAATKRVGGLQAQANLERILVAARQLSESGLSFGAVVRGLAERTGSEAGEPRAFEEDVEAVRILTIHKAKGLEFPVTIVTGLGAATGGGSSPVIFGASGAWAASLGIAGLSVETPDWSVVREQNRQRELAEEKRLFYVACTRAQDLLVVSCFRDITTTQKGISDAGDRASTLFGRLRKHLDRAAQRPGLVDRKQPRPEPRAVAVPTKAEGAPPDLARQLQEEASRPAQLARERAQALRRAGHAAGEEAAAEDLPAEERERFAVSDAAVRIGSAVHEAMQAIVERGLDVARAAALAAADWELSAEGRKDVEELARRLADSPLFARAAAAGRRLAETPVLFRDEAGFLVEGKIDLLFEEESGFVLVDYKTDRDLTKRMPEYTAQLSDYAAALRVLGLPRPVAAAFLLSARTGEATPVPI